MVSLAVSAAEMSGSNTPAVPRDWPHVAHSRLVESYGTRWHVQRLGSGPTLVLLHGTAASTHSFRQLLEPLAADFDVVMIDLPGHGFSSALPGGRMTLPDIARGLEGLFASLGVEPRYLVGHSAGAAIALRLALDEDETVRAVVGLNAALLPFGGILNNLFSPLAMFFASTRMMPRMLARRAEDPKAVERVIRGTGSVLGADGIRLYQRLFRSESHIAAVLSMMASWDLSRLCEELPGLNARLLLVTGRRDLAVRPSEAVRVAGSVPGVVVDELPDCGHLAHEEAPERVAGIIRRFCLDEAA